MYAKDEVVWAKIKGYPWWPAVVVKVIEDREEKGVIHEILVNFLGENSHAQLTLDKVAKFEENFEEYGKLKKKKLMDSIIIARNIIAKQTTYEEERDKLDRKNGILPESNTKRKRDKELSVEPDQESGHDSEPELPPPSIKYKKKAKQFEKKEIKTKHMNINMTKSPNMTTADRSPVIIKNVKPSHQAIGNGPIIQTLTHSKDPDSKESGKINRAKKLLNLEIDDSTKLQSVPSTALLQRTPAEVLTQPEKKEAKVIPKIAKSHVAFEGILDNLIERVENKDISNISTLEKKILGVITKINPQEAPIPELLEKEAGKNIYTILVLFDQLFDNIDNNDSEVSDIFNNIRDQLITTSNTIKNRVSNYFVENVEFSGAWLRKLDERLNQKDQGEKESKSTRSSEREKLKENIAVKIIDLESDESSRGQKENITVKVIDLESEGSSRGQNEKLDEEPTDGITPEEEKNNSDSSSKEGDKPRKNTTSTKLQKHSKSDPTHKKSEHKNETHTSGQNLRKKICLKMAKLIQDKNSAGKEEAQKITVELETKIREFDPEMGSDYRAKIMIILKLLKFSLIDCKELVKEREINFQELKSKYDEYTSIHGGDHGDMLGEEQLSLNRDPKSEIEMNTGESGIIVNI